MGIINFRIVFDKPVYMGGDDVTGKVLLSITGGETKIRGLKLQITGIITVSWWEEMEEKSNEGSYDYEEETHIVKAKKVQKEVFYRQQGVVLEKGNHQLTIGDHEFAFRVPLPDTGIYGTFRSKEKGAVDWEAKCEIDIPWGFNKNVVETIFVNNLIDLNKHPQSIQPFKDSKQKTFGFLCCKSGPLDLDVNIMKTGFVCGEEVTLNIQVNNKTNKVLSIIVSVFQNTTFKRLRKSAELDVIQKQVVQQCPPETNETLCHKLKIPLCAPSTQNLYGAMDIEYFLQVD
ncbi:hypothetical protein TCAL_13063, partial [Tigriopus californicus]